VNAKGRIISGPHPWTKAKALTPSRLGGRVAPHTFAVLNRMEILGRNP